MKRTRAGIFITGTDTGVGKTYVAVRIVEELRRRGTDVGVMKPAETGCGSRAGTLVPADALRLIKAAGSREPLDRVNPYRFRKALAPSVAAALDGTRIEPSNMLRAFRRLSDDHQFMLVEGAGGILVPLTERYSHLDLAKDLGLPVMIVARPGLGTINHTLMTIAMLRSRKIPIAGVVINHSEAGKPGQAERTSPVVIERLSGVPIFGIVRHGSAAVKGIVDRISGPPAGRREAGD